MQDFLSTEFVDTLLRTHPNDNGNIPESWASWWAWAGSAASCVSSSHVSAAPWMRLLEYYCSGTQTPTALQRVNIRPFEYQDADIPEQLRVFIEKLRQLSLDRTPIDIHGQWHAVPTIQASAVGMSPKKSHEVFRMTAYVASFIRGCGIDPATACIVDVGAGQGYLTRTLQLHIQCRGILALDGDDAQTAGAKKWEKKLCIEDSVTHRTIWITPMNLIETVDQWAADLQRADDESMPVFFVALHACGSLTPTILRTFAEGRRRLSSRIEGTPPLWHPAGVVAVGCCYNLMHPDDFPMSTALISHRQNMSPPASALPASAYHLATQIPGVWVQTPEALTNATLAVRKIVWRALLSHDFSLKPFTAKSTSREFELHSDLSCARGETPSARRQSCIGTEGTGMRPEMQRLGKLNNKFYDNWEDFVAAAAERMGFKPIQEGTRPDPEKRYALENQLSVLHILRCMTGPLVESLVVSDRRAWLVEQLNGTSDATEYASSMMVAIVNLFDQATGSGRNIAITAVPRHD
ncbi:methyltransferase domain-containing protein [Schizophyllum amplum]|uniref:Methyltransferase domain-containing protein n=1 Tax=Schizophyllum amplum TaxID=97359 RepID=A0A550C904_9AGAR|nr:methyltransferase domain-containing protein [Auriculariopsis ampla]